MKTYGSLSLILITTFFSFSLLNNLHAMEENFELPIKNHSSSLSFLRDTLETLALRGNSYSSPAPTINEPLTAEIVRNDYWCSLVTKEQKEKDNALREILMLIFTDWGYPELRRHIAAAVLIAGANPNIENSYSRPLSKAVIHNDFHLANLLLQHKADPNAADYGISCISTAQTVKMAQLLINAGAHIQDTTDLNLLDDCIIGDHEPELIPFYRKLGLSPLKKCDFSFTPLHWLALRPGGSPEKAIQKCNLLLDGLTPTEIIQLCTGKNKQGKTPLMLLQEDEISPTQKALYTLLQQRLSDANKLTAKC